MSTTFDPKWVDVGSLKSWLQICDSEHEPCKLPPWSATSGPTWLIDVENGCLVRASAGGRYVALSYVWGQAQTMEAKRDNLGALMLPEALFAHFESLPRTISHAFQLTSLLDIPFLWVDRLCIPQDDDDFKSEEIRRMGYIYENAYVTIVAANGWDANHGLRGLKDISEPRTLSRYDYDIENLFSTSETAPFWYTRGWTFQEMILSQRIIMFHYQAVMWDCKCVGWHELSDVRVRNDRDSMLVNCMCRSRLNRKFQPFPDVRQYISFVQEYNTRDLTYPEDTLYAFSGLITAWERTFSGGFIGGLPQMFFDAAILWQGASTLQRRPEFPSWSWLGWKGEIDISAWSTKWSSLSSNRMSNSRPQSAIEWKYQTRDGSKKDVDISSRRYAHFQVETDLPLPEGWLREGDEAEAIFYHPSWPGLETLYPLPLPPDPENQNTESQSEDGKLLFAQVERGIFPNSIANPSNSSIKVVNAHCSMMGRIYVDDMSMVEDLRNLELVKTSEGSPSFRSMDLPWPSDRQQWTESDEARFRSVVNVLLITWREGVAYRRGVGQVGKQDWDEHETDWVDLVLG